MIVSTSIPWKRIIPVFGAAIGAGAGGGGGGGTTAMLALSAGGVARRVGSRVTPARFSVRALFGGAAAALAGGAFGGFDEVPSPAGSSSDAAGSSSAAGAMASPDIS